MKRFLSLWFPDWSLDRLRRSRRVQQGKAPHPIKQAGNGQADPGRKILAGPSSKKPAFALIEQGPHGLLVAAVNPTARAMGIAPGLGFTDARARVPDLVFEEIDRVADEAALRRLAGWMVRYTPHTALDGPDSLMLDITGCDHLHDGETALARRLSSKLHAQGFIHQLAIAGTPGCAHALSHTPASGEPIILEVGAEQRGLATLPVSALRISDGAETLLRRFGLTRIGQLYGIDRKSLARRFASKDLADQVVLRLDQALGHRLEPLKPLRPPPAFEARLNCAEPIATSDAVKEGLRRLTGQICDELASLGQGARSFTLHACRSDGSLSSIHVSAARAVREPAHILRLFSERIDRIDPGFGIDLLILEAHRVGEMGDTRQVLSGELAGEDIDLSAISSLADRLTARLGEGCVTVCQPVASHLPEKSERPVAFQGSFPVAPDQRPVAPRPLRIFDRPETIEVMAEVPDGAPIQFRWRRIMTRVARADGPERINPEWWTSFAPVGHAPRPEGARADWLAPKLDPRADAGQITKIRRELQDTSGQVLRNLPRARDYYRVEDTSGRRYWLFRDGLFEDGRGGRPNWYIHGVFA